MQPRQRNRCWPAALSALVLLMLVQTGWAQVEMIKDDFSNGIDPDIYQPIGSAVLSIDNSDPSNPKLNVQMNNFDDGVRINIPQNLPGNPSAKCLRVSQEIRPFNTFLPGSRWEHAVEMVGPDGDVARLVLSGTRSAWNRCEYNFDIEGSDTVTTGFLDPRDKGHAARLGCPDPKDVRFDWSKMDGMEFIEIEVVSGDMQDTSKYFTKKKSKDVKHFPGGDEPQGPGEYRITAYTVTFNREKPPEEVCND